MPPRNTPRKRASIVKIERGQYSPTFQVVRAYLSAASAVASTDANRMVAFIDDAVTELRIMRSQVLEATR